ncbi:MAG: SpoIIE family protein phosphatase [Acidimicrobiales bacterium]
MDQSREDELLPVLRAALDQTRSAACITLSQLDWPGPEIVYVNPAYCTMTGRDADEVIGQTPRIMQGPLTSRAVLDRLRNDLDAGRPFVGETVNYRKDGSPYLINWRIDPVLAVDGRVTHYIATQEDVTRLRRAERLLAAEQAIGRAVSTLMSEPADTTDNLESLSAEIVAATATVAGYGKVSLEGSIRLGTRAERFCSGVPLSEHPEPFEELDFESNRLQGGRFEGHLWAGCSLRNERSGLDGALIVWGLTPAERDFLDDEGLRRVVDYAARALESVADYERRRLLAIELQRGLLPTTPTPVPGVEIASLYQPGAFSTRIGGDWYDVFRDEDRAVLVVGDMAGSGVRAAADMGRLRLLVRIMLQQGATSSSLFSQLNQYCAVEDLVATVLAVTLELDEDGTPTGVMKITAAGHPPPLRKRGGMVEVLDLSPGPLLGIGGDPAYREQVFELLHQDSVVLFTDGLVERRDEAIDTSLQDMVKRTADRWSSEDPAIETLCSWLVEQRLRAGSSDDIAVLGFRRDGPTSTG